MMLLSKLLAEDAAVKQVAAAATLHTKPAQSLLLCLLLLLNF
jgi:hypothetical protein